MGKKAAPRSLADNEAKASAESLRVSARKLNLVAQSIRGKNCNDAIAQLTFSKRRISNDVRKVLQSAIANAENNHQLDVDRLFVAEASVGRAMVIKRFRPRARGRVGRIEKPFSKLTVVLREREETA
ncbi:MAG: 50S ribosomal protein L22 [Rhodospirillales bacterium]|nr:50S ribosomal protein L22 [Rhodospirillales bacterium]MCW8863011.1 50S ribosomal protein L22 [Rhodospirillales bacterium]MCW8951804.1 50S ribosomal protein L22 [Rhodospirillales bacterium]MCW8971111.1 50S ribosomal protein L22 [Rhodospirillales bacterium]MCW9002217.1 50S ribosomal protein L22 [Rhodospirillales bacterium]